jgi:hypothetical protein
MIDPVGPMFSQATVCGVFLFGSATRETASTLAWRKRWPGMGDSFAVDDNISGESVAWQGAKALVG